MDLLLKIHYPRFQEGEKGACPRRRRATRTSWGTARKICTSERFRYTAANLAPFKAPGVDGVYPVLLQEGIEGLIGPLTHILRSFVALGHVTEA